jgi:hypothetical protein
MALDACIPITRVTNGENCAGEPGPISCGMPLIPVRLCDRVVDAPPDRTRCVNDIVRRPWPSPPQADVGCNPISLQVTNSTEEAVEGLELRGEVDYIGNDACLPQIKLGLFGAPNIFTRINNVTSTLSGYGYTHGGRCVRVGPNEGFKNSDDFFGNVYGAAAFVPVDPLPPDPCQPPCEYKANYGGHVAKFNIIGPIMATIIGASVIRSSVIHGKEIAWAWQYGFEFGNCVLAGNQCYPADSACQEGLWFENDDDLGGAGGEVCYNIKENGMDGTYNKFLTPGVDVGQLVMEGYAPQPIMTGTPVLLYGWVTWTRTPNPADQDDNCACPIVWFFDVPNAIDGNCDDAIVTEGAQQASMLPQRNVTSAGMFFGDPSNANRV